jgi:uncharacterized protein YkwD
MLRSITALAVASPLALAGTAHADLASVARGCPNSTVPISATSVQQSRAALSCLIDGTRRDHGLRSVQSDGKLTDVADSHASDMVKRRYFSHVTPAGTDPFDRLRKIGWTPKDKAWWAGEILVLGTGTSSSPQRLVGAWLNSPPHRRILLSSEATEVGIGVSRNTPEGDAPQSGATAVAEFGRVGPKPPKPPAADDEDPLSNYETDTPTAGG